MRRETNALYVCTTAAGERVTVRGHTEWSVDDIKAAAARQHRCSIVDVVDEQRDKREERV